MPSIRCPYCHDGLRGEPIRTCGDCGTAVHLVCLREHGGCPILGCGNGRAFASGLVSWDELVREARPWLELGASLTWEQPSTSAFFPDATDSTDDGSGSSSRAA